MKILKYVLAFFFIGISTTIFAQKGTNIIKTGYHRYSYGESLAYNNAEFVTHGFGASFERGVASKVSLALSYDFGRKNFDTEFLNASLEGSVDVANLELEGRYYFKEATNGFFLGVAGGTSLVNYNLVLDRRSGRERTYTDNNRWSSFNFSTGYQAHLSPNLTFQVRGIFGIVNATEQDDKTSRLGLSFQLGYLF